MRSKELTEKVKKQSLLIRLDQTKRKLLIGIVQTLMKDKVYSIEISGVIRKDYSPELTLLGWDLDYPKTVKVDYIQLVDDPDSAVFKPVVSPMVIMSKGVSSEEFRFVRELLDTISSMYNYMSTMKEVDHGSATLMLKDKTELWKSFGFTDYEMEMVAQVVTWFAEVLSKTLVELIGELENIYGTTLNT